MDKSRECFSMRNTHRTLASGAPDAESERPVQTVPGPARVRHRTLGTGRRLERPVVRVRCEVCFAMLPGFKSGEHRTVRCPARFADLPEFRTGVHRTRPASVSKGKTWLTLEHRTLVLSIWCPFKSVR